MPWICKIYLHLFVCQLNCPRCRHFVGCNFNAIFFERHFHSRRVVFNYSLGYWVSIPFFMSWLKELNFIKIRGSGVLDKTDKQLASTTIILPDRKDSITKFAEITAFCNVKYVVTFPSGVGIMIALYINWYFVVQTGRKFTFDVFKINSMQKTKIKTIKWFGTIIFWTLQFKKIELMKLALWWFNSRATFCQ